MHKVLLWSIIIAAWLYLLIGFWLDFPNKGLIAPYGWWLAIPIGIAMWVVIWVVFLKR